MFVRPQLSSALVPQLDTMCLTFSCWFSQIQANYILGQVPRESSFLAMFSNHFSIDPRSYRTHDVITVVTDHLGCKPKSAYNLGLAQRRPMLLWPAHSGFRVSDMVVKALAGCPCTNAHEPHSFLYKALFPLILQPLPLFFFVLSRCLWLTTIHLFSSPSLAKPLGLVECPKRHPLIPFRVKVHAFLPLCPAFRCCLCV